MLSCGDCDESHMYDKTSIADSVNEITFMTRNKTQPSTNALPSEPLDPRDLVSEKIKEMKDSGDIDRDLLEILEKHILNADEGTLSVENAAKEIERLAETRAGKERNARNTD